MLFRKYSSKIISDAHEMSKIKGFFHSNKIKVFTNGCFDILHQGHVSYLEKARELGDLLIVAINSDSSVKKLKGDLRPVRSLKDRLAVLAALECVDWVIGFEEDTPLNLILEIQPDILVKGGDWQGQTIIGAMEMETWGGRVIFVPYIEGRSTTRILEAFSEKKAQGSLLS